MLKESVIKMIDLYNKYTTLWREDLSNEYYRGQRDAYYNCIMELHVVYKFELNMKNELFEWVGENK